jgi:inorganic pyrophosphatase
MHRPLAAHRGYRGGTTEDGETKRNDRLLAVASNSAAHRSILQLNDLSTDLITQIEHFFVSYNEIKGKRFQSEGACRKQAGPRTRPGGDEGPSRR